MDRQIPLLKPRTSGFPSGITLHNIAVNTDCSVDSHKNLEDVALYVAYTVHSRLSMLKARRKSRHRQVAHPRMYAPGPGVPSMTVIRLGPVLFEEFAPIAIHNGLAEANARL